MGEKPLNVSIENMNHTELDEVLRIAIKEIYEGASLQEMREWVCSEGVSRTGVYSSWYIAKIHETNEIVAFIQYGAHDIDFKNRKVIISIFLLAVKSEFHKRGIGSKLVEISLERICRAWREKGFEPIMIRAETDEERIAARSFYESVLANPERAILENVWGPSKGTVLYYKRLTVDT